jgi:hypothetical protein
VLVPFCYDRIGIEGFRLARRVMQMPFQGYSRPAPAYTRFDDPPRVRICPSHRNPPTSDGGR